MLRRTSLCFCFLSWFYVFNGYWKHEVAMAKGSLWLVVTSHGSFMSSFGGQNFQKHQLVLRRTSSCFCFLPLFYVFNDYWKLKVAMAKVAKAPAGALTHQLVLCVFKSISCFHQIFCNTYKGSPGTNILSSLSGKY